MLNIINKMFNRSTVTTTKPDDRDIFTRISIHHDKNVRKVNKTTVVRLQGNKKEAVVEVLRKGIPMTARELANVTGFKLSTLHLRCNMILRTYLIVESLRKQVTVNVCSRVMFVYFIN